MSAIEDRAKDEGVADAGASEPPSSGIRQALAVPRPRPRVLPGKEVLPAPGVPETPRRERNQTSSFWPAPPEALKPARPSKRGTPLTTTTHGFPEADLRAGAPAARRSAPPPRPRAVEVEVQAKVEAPPRELDRELDRVPPPPRSKRKHTDQGWPPPAVAALDVAASPEASDVESEQSAPVASRIVVEAAPVPVVETALQPVANDVALAPIFGGEDDEIELPLRRASRRTLWLVALAALIALAAVVSAVAR